MQSTERHGHLEGLRGLACLQVLLLHGFGAFLPALVGPEMPALVRLAYDGDLAVFLFFVLSGHVLTPAFLRGISSPGRLVLGRLVRFLLPALLACTLGWLLAGPALSAGQALGSVWLIQNIPPDTSAAALARDAGLNVLLLGYAGLSVFDEVAPGLLWLNGEGFNPPLWTLSVELQGSLVVLLLCRVRGLAGWVWPGCLLIALLVCARTPFAGFIAGHVLALHRPGLRLLACALVVSALSVAMDPAVLPALPDAMLWRMLAAIGVFVTVQAAPALQRLLAADALRRLGALSFPLYLVHWPLLFGPGAVAALALAPLGAIPAGLGGIAVGLGLTAMLAPAFRRIDLLALAWSRRVRQWRPTLAENTLPA